MIFGATYGWWILRPSGPDEQEETSDSAGKNFSDGEFVPGFQAEPSRNRTGSRECILLFPPRCRGRELRREGGSRHLSEKRICAPRITLPSCKAIIAYLKRMIKGNRKSRQEKTKKDRYEKEKQKTHWEGQTVLKRKRRYRNDGKKDYGRDAAVL